MPRPSDLTTLLTRLLVPLVRRVVAPWGTDGQAREELRVRERQEPEYHLWRGSTWFVVGSVLCLGAVAMLVVAMLVGSGVLERLSGTMIRLGVAALPMVLLSAVCHGATDHLRPSAAVRLLTSPAWDWLLLSVGLIIVFTY